jgi:hypothetical protein
VAPRAGQPRGALDGGDGGAHRHAGRQGLAGLIRQIPPLPLDPDAVDHLADAAHPRNALQCLTHRLERRLHTGQHHHAVAHRNLDVRRHDALLVLENAAHLGGDALVVRQRLAFGHGARGATGAQQADQQQRDEPHNDLLESGKCVTVQALQGRFGLWGYL